MNDVAAKIPARWRDVAIKLGLEVEELNSVDERVPSRDPHQCYYHVFNIWKAKNTTPYTWESVIKALKSSSVDEQKIAEDIESH